MSPDEIYRRLLQKVQIATRKPPNFGWPRETILGRWTVLRLDNGIGRKLGFLFKTEGEVRYQLLDTVIAINGIDGEVCEIRWHPRPDDDDLVEIMMLVS